MWAVVEHTYHIHRHEDGWLRADAVPHPRRQRKLFCLHKGRDSVIFELDPKTGDHLNQLCTHFRDMECYGGRTWPIDDIMLSFKLALETHPHLVDAATAECFPRGHQRPDLRGPYFKAEWAYRPLPGMERPVRERAMRQYIRGIEPRYVILDEMHDMQRRIPIERFEMKPLGLADVRKAAEEMRNLYRAAPFQYAAYDELRDEICNVAQAMRDLEQLMDHEVVGLRAFLDDKPKPVEKIELKLLDGIDRELQLPEPN